MPISSGDLVFYGSANMPTGDATTAGGAIDTSTRVIFDDTTLANAVGPSVLSVVSTIAGDNSGILIYGRDAGGALINSTITLSGLTPVTGVVSYDRIHMVSGQHNGTLSLKKAASVIVAMESGVNVIRRPFFNAIADASGGSSRTYYEKVFLKNNHATLTLTSAFISGSSSGLASFVDISAESGTGGTTTITNRLTSPTGISPFGDGSVSIANVVAGGTQPVWLSLTLAAGTAPQLGLYTIAALGNTT